MEREEDILFPNPETRIPSHRQSGEVQRLFDDPIIKSLDIEETMRLGAEMSQGKELTTCEQVLLQVLCPEMIILEGLDKVKKL